MRLSQAAELGDWIAALAWAPDGGAVAAACADGAIVTLAPGTGDITDVHRHDAPATCLAWSSSGVLASGGQDGRVFIGPRTVQAGGGWVERVAWRPDGATLAVAHGRRVQLRAADAGQVATSRDFPATITCLGWHPGGVHVAAGSYGGVWLLRGRDARVTKPLRWKGSVLELAISADGRRLAHGNQDASVHFWDLRKDTELEMSGYATKVRELAWRHDGRLLATGGGTAVTVWDFSARGPAGTRPRELQQHDEQVSWLGFAPGSPLLASTGADGLALLWKPGRDDLPLASAAMDDRITTAAWSPDGHRLAVGGAHGTLAVLDVHHAGA